VFITNFVTNAASFLVVTSGMSDFCSNVRVYVLINIKYYKVTPDVSFIWRLSQIV